MRTTYAPKSSRATERLPRGLCELQPLGHQSSCVFFEPAFAIERLRRYVFAADLQAQRLQAGFSAHVLTKRHDSPAQFLPAICFVEIDLVQQSEAAMKFQTVTISKREISGQFVAEKDEIDLSQPGIVEQVLDGARCGRVFKYHFLLRVEAAHHLQQGRELLFG